MLLAFASLLGCLLTSSQAKVYSRCELARALQDFGMEGYRGSTLADCENHSPSHGCPSPLPPSRLPSFSALPLGCDLGSFLSLSPPLSIKGSRTRRVGHIQHS